MCHQKRGERHPNVYVCQPYQHHYHILYKYIYHEPPKIILQILQHQTTSVCPTHKARSMLALARPVPATMVQWPRGVNPRLGLKRSPQRLTCHLPWQPFKDAKDGLGSLCHSKFQSIAHPMVTWKAPLQYVEFSWIVSRCHWYKISGTSVTVSGCVATCWKHREALALTITNMDNSIIYIIIYILHNAYIIYWKFL